MNNRPSNGVRDSLNDLAGRLRLLTSFNESFARVYHDLTVLSQCQIPRSGPAILLCNHTAGIDPFLLQSACPRLVVWMMAREYYELRLFRTIFVAMDAIPVGRDGRDMSATRSALRVLKEGRVLGIFPEGRIEPERQLLPFQIGVALLAIKSQAPVFPAYLDGTQRGRDLVPALLRPCQATVAFGPEIAFDRSDASREGLERATAAFAAHVQRLKDLTEGRHPLQQGEV